MGLFLKKFERLVHPSSWRRISIANWAAPNDPTVYGFLDIDFTNVLSFLSKINTDCDLKTSPTHVVAKAMALVLKKYPDLNGIIRWKKIYLRKTVDIFLQVAIDGASSGGKPDLSGAKIENCDQKSLADICRELKDKSQKIRQKTDPQFQKTFALMAKIPQFLLGFIVKLGSFLTYNFDLNLPGLGFPADPFGSAMVTSVGMLKMPPGLAPLVPVSRVPLIVCLGEIRDKAWVVNNEIVIRPIAQLGITFDHRFIDGLTGSQMAKYLEEILEHPEIYFV